MFFKRSKITSNDNRAPVAAVEPSLVGPGMTIDGNITSQGEVRIEGIVRGTVDAAICVVGRDGQVEGRIIAEEVYVSGTVRGPINGLHVQLESGAHVEGDVVNGSIAVQNGAHIHGSIWHSDNPLDDATQEETGAKSKPAPAGHFLESPLWGTPQDDAYRPVKVIKPR